MERAGEVEADRLVKIVVGLGNPGRQYAWNRHNIGFMVLDALAREAKAKWSNDIHSLCLACAIEIAGQKALLAKPLTFMNQSGIAVQGLLSALQRSHKDLILVLDDFNLPFGRIRIRERGSAGGHRGLESILGIFDTEEIVRIRVGIGEESMPEEKSEFVLADFPPERREQLNNVIIHGGNAVKSILRDGVSKTMTIFNA